jgi:hypothetical protein
MVALIAAVGPGVGLRPTGAVGQTPAPAPEKPPVAGMVWVDPESPLRFYYKEGHRLYGRRSEVPKGKFMTEQEAQKAGFRLAPR